MAVNGTKREVAPRPSKRSPAMRARGESVALPAEAEGLSDLQRIDEALARIKAREPAITARIDAMLAGIR